VDNYAVIHSTEIAGDTGRMACYLMAVSGVLVPETAIKSG